MLNHVAVAVHLALVGDVSDKDEDDDHWWRRCIAVSAAMMRPVKYRIRRSR